jgi:integral membrane sensor domain MASE1
MSIMERISGLREIIISPDILPAVPAISGRSLSWRRVAQIAAVALAYFAAARFGLSFAVVAEQVTVVWPPSGIALAALLVLGSPVWRGVGSGVWLGALAANLLAHEGPLTAAAIATGNTLEAVAGAWLLRRVHFRERLDRVWDVMGLLGLAAALSTTVAASVGATSLCASGLQPWSVFGRLWFEWWLGDAMGILLYAPALLIWGARPRLSFSGRAAEAIVLGACVVSATVASFGGRFAQLTGSHFAYLVFPLLIWAAVRFGQRGAAPAILIVTGLAVAFTVQGRKGHEVRTAHDGPSALAAAREHRPELVLLDIGLPAGMDGYKVAQRMRPEPGLESAVIVAVTGFGQEEDRRRAAAAGFDRHLVKPVDMQQLWRLLREL